MFGLYLLAAIATQLVTSAGHVSFDLNEAEFVTHVPLLHGVKSGSPVTVKGELVGAVSSIEKVSSKNNSEVFKLNFKIGPKYKNLVRNGAFALVTSPVAPNGIKDTGAIDLIIAQGKGSTKASASNVIPGFSSYKEFWNAHDVKI